MHTNDGNKNSTPLTDLGYETRDIQVKSLVRALTFFFGFAIFSGVLAAIFIKIFVPEMPAPQSAFVRAYPPKGTPILQNNVNNTADIADLRRQEAEILTTSGKGDAPGYYRIPIDKAIKLIAQRGLPKPIAVGSSTSAPAALAPSDPAAVPAGNGPAAAPVTSTPSGNTPAGTAPATGVVR